MSPRSGLSPSDPASGAARVAAALERLERLHPRKIDLSLDRVYRLLDALGAPHRALAPVVHIAGTNGKGSTLAILRAVLESAGRRVHAYTSPHLVRFNERIRLNGRTIDDHRLADLLDRCEAANDGQPITYFEITTCAALLAFAETPADVVLLETGLGGRLDATNVVARPAVTAITRISMDHMAFLGDTIDRIAAEKAGILKPDVPCVVSPQAEPIVVEVIEARAAAVGAPLLLQGRDWSVSPTDDGFRLSTATGERRWPFPSLPGAHQIANAATALMCLDRLPGGTADTEAISRGLRSVDWPARLQRLTRGPLAMALPADWELWLDGGHNDSAGAALAAWAAALEPRPLHLVVGMLDSKDPVPFLAPLAPHAASLTAIPVAGAAALPPPALAQAAQQLGFPAVGIADGPGAALAALPRPDGPARLLVCGSLYLAGSVLAENG